MTDVWDDDLLANPHTVADKRRRVQRMFAAIAPSYDVNNHLHSLWMDQAWRRKAVRLAKLLPSDRVVDVACGTGDLTLAFRRGLMKAGCKTLKSSQVLGIDFTFEMLPLAVRKWENRSQLKDAAARQAVCFINGDAQSLPIPDSCCDVVSIAFGIRNVADPNAAISELYRVLRPGGRLLILEFSLPTNPLLSSLYNFYFRQILPRTATLISGDRTGAYRYLPRSVNTFISRETMVEMIYDAGFQDVRQYPMTSGICICYRGVKR